MAAQGVQRGAIPPFAPVGSRLPKGRQPFQGPAGARIRVTALKATGTTGAAPRQGITASTQGPGAVLAAEVVLVPVPSLRLGAAPGEDELEEGEQRGLFIHSFIPSFIHPVATP